ncbi:MAG: hypothetical protein CR961_00470 [Polaribacter sp.]|nr:MAG: hypothetical protein CR961_00470 [Polaribacter sp.]
MNKREEFIRSILKDNPESKKTKIRSWVYVILISVGSLMVIFTILSSIFKWNFSVFYWDKMQVLVISTLSLWETFLESFVSLMFSNHLKKIKNKTIDNDNLDIQLERICRRIDNGVFSTIFYFVIIIVAIWLYEEQTYWEYLKIPILIVYLLLILKTINIYVKLKRNITEFEKL